VHGGRGAAAPSIILILTAVHGPLPLTTASHMSHVPSGHSSRILTTPPAARTLAPSPWQAVDDSSRDEEIWAAALGGKVSPTGPVRKARRMSGAERRKHSKQANITHVTHHGYA